jgi:YesN/AraC family two-component response regulator
LDPEKKSFRRGKVFYRLLYSYLIILLIPLSLSLFVFRQTQGMLSKEAERANGLLLTQLQVYCDKIMNDALSITSLISNNARIEGLIYEKGEVDSNILYRAYSAADDFEDYLLANNSIISFYAYLPSLDLVISPFGFYSSHSFYNNHLQKLDFSYDQWLSYFKNTKGRYFAPFQTTNMSEQLIQTMGVFSPLPITSVSGNPAGICVVEVDLDSFKSLMRDTTWTDESILAIYDREGGIILSSRKVDWDKLVISDNLEDLTPGFAYNINLEGESYAVLISQSQVVPWSYISLVPLDIYNDQFNTLMRLLILFIIACALGGGIVVYFITRSRYKPIQDILSLVQIDGESNVTLNSDEFNMIARNITLTMDEDSRLKHEMEESLPVLRQRELRLLLKGELEDDEDEALRLQKLNLSLEKTFFLLILLDIELEEDAPAALKDECITLLQGINQDTSYLYLIKDLDGHVAYLINRNENTYYEILEKMAKLRDDVEREYPVAVAMGLSGLHLREDGFPRLYREASRALDYRLIKGRKQPILYEDITKFTHSYYYPMDVEKKLISAIKSGAEQEAFDLLNALFDRNYGEETFISLEMGRCFMYELIATLVKAMDKILSSEEDGSFWYDLSPIHRLTDCKSLEVLKLEMEEIFYQVCSHIKKGKKSHNDELKESILTYVEKNLTDPALCVESIALHCERNAAYLARFFKEQKAIGLAQYIKQRRVELSLEQLLDDKKTVGTVAEEIGFSNANAFIRAFKEIEGMTPGQFRENRFL